MLNRTKINKKADMPGWSYVVGLIIGLFVIALIIFIATKSKDSILKLLGLL